MLKYLTENKLARYILVGGSSYLFELAVLYSLIFLGVHKVLAVGIAFWFGLLLSFILQKLVAFNNKERTYKKILWQSVCYGILVIINYTFTLLVVSTFSDEFGIFLTRTVALIITTGWNFIIYSKIIFRKSL
jgi:putative flippase GtrA